MGRPLCITNVNSISRNRNLAPIQKKSAQLTLHIRLPLWLASGWLRLQWHQYNGRQMIVYLKPYFFHLYCMFCSALHQNSRRCTKAACIIASSCISPAGHSL